MTNRPLDALPNLTQHHREQERHPSLPIEVLGKDPSACRSQSKITAQIDGYRSSSWERSHVVRATAIRTDERLCRDVQPIRDVVEAVVEEVAVLVQGHRR